VDVADMQARIRALADDRELLATYAAKSHEAAQVYDEARLEKVWHDFYVQQAALGKH
jgi:1,2-diacylglycerol-3-alpha-glucose alpha-1,2-galactosyltransferase